MKVLADLVTALENNLPFIDATNKKVSKASVGWHLEHSLLALIKMISAVEHSEPKDFKANFNWKRSLILALGKMPRGKARVPDSVKPGEEISEATIRPLLEKAKQKVELFESLSNDKYFTHPVFGDVQLKKTRKVIAIHTLHHISIIKDILEK